MVDPIVYLLEVEDRWADAKAEHRMLRAIGMTFGFNTDGYMLCNHHHQAAGVLIRSEGDVCDAITEALTDGMEFVPLGRTMPKIIVTPFPMPYLPFWDGTASQTSKWIEILQALKARYGQW